MYVIEVNEGGTWRPTRYRAETEDAARRLAIQFFDGYLNRHFGGTATVRIVKREAA